MTNIRMSKPIVINIACSGGTHTFMRVIGTRTGDTKRGWFHNTGQAARGKGVGW